MAIERTKPDDRKDKYTLTLDGGQNRAIVLGLRGLLLKPGETSEEAMARFDADSVPIANLPAPAPASRQVSSPVPDAE